MSHPQSPLQDDSAFLQEVIQGATVGVVLYDEHGQCILKNRLFDKLLDLPAHFLSGHFTFEALVQLCFERGDYGADKSKNIILDFYRHRMAAQSTLHLERRLANGKWLEVRYLPLKNQRAMFTYRDITTARKYEEQVRRFESIIESSEDAIITKDLTGLITSWNGAAQRMFGYTAEDIIGEHISRLVPADRLAEMHDILERVGHGQTVRAYDTVRLHQNGDGVHVSISVTPVYDRFGRIAGACAVARNIQERIEAHNELELAQLVFLNANEAMMVCDENNKVVLVNPAFTRLTGYRAEEVLGQDPKFLGSGSHDENFYGTMWKAITETGKWDGEIINRRKNGETYVERMGISSAYRQDGRVHRRIAIFSDITEKKQAEEKIWHAANYDQLTQLPNRHYFQAKLNEQIAAAHRYQSGFALLFLDLDKFKEVNDTYGHLYGDILLQQVAERIAGCLRKTDFISRLGGDEFTVILSNLVATDKISEIAQNILDRLRAPFDLGLPEQEPTFISCSIGITLYPSDADNQVDLLKNADQAMYLSKKNGRDCFSYFSPELNQQALERIRTLNELRLAVSEQQLEVYYQPIIDLHTRQIKKAEALVRWHHPRHGMVLPATFVKLAEETGLIHEVGDWVMRQVQIHLDEIQARDPGMPIQISINVSPIQLHAKNNPIERFANEALLQSRLLIEVTESVLLNIDEFMTNTMYLFRDKGLQVAIDDFGTGYSSLDYLRKLDIDYLKIDRSFVQNLGENSSDNALCEAIVMMAHKLGIKVIAEGVETQRQHDCLCQMGCDMAQGYFYYYPMPFDAFLALSPASDQAA